MYGEPQIWPELVGINGSEAAEIIKRETGFTQVHILPPNSMVTMDYRTDRVRIYVNEEGIVTRPPAIG